MFTRAALVVVATLIAVPAGAEDLPALDGDPAPEAQTDQGMSLIEQGARIILRSLLDQAEPALRDMQKDFGTAMDELAPMLRDLATMAGDLNNYHAPEKLPNGDIILRHKTPGEMAADPDAPQTDL